MKKVQLQAECDERGLEAKGTVAELRAVLRFERKKDTKLIELEERMAAGEDITPLLPTAPGAWPKVCIDPATGEQKAE